MAFSKVIGQEAAKNTLRQMAGGERLPHALLLLGPQGCGKLALALALAQYILCRDKTAADACGQCPQCLKAEKLVHPDIHFSYPAVGPKAISDQFASQWRASVLANPYQDINQWLQSIGAENKQGNITRDECVHIVKKLSLKAFEGEHKILIMWLPEFLGKEGNRLLKIIEEPPDKTVFILVAEDQEQILNTIISRCQIVNVKALSDEEVAAGLSAQQNLAPEQALRIAFLANGNYNEALQLAAQQANDNAGLFVDWMRKCFKGHGVEMAKWAEAFAGQGRENQKYFLRYALHFLRELSVVKICGADRARLQAAELATAQKMAAQLELEQLEQLGKLFSDCAFAVERNANPKILFLDASIQMHKIMKGKSAEAYAGLPATVVP
jgi:DNA polymerase III subunit delta'